MILFRDVAIQFDRAGARPALTRAGEYFVYHLTQGTRLALDGAGKPNPQGFDPAFKITGRLRIEASKDEDLADYQFGFLQVASAMHFKARWAGRLKEHGHVRRNLLASFAKNPSLDADTAFAPWTRPNPSSVSVLPDVADRVQRAITCPLGVKGGDHPSGYVPLKRPNGFTNADNYLYEVHHDIAFVAALVMRDSRDERITQIAHVTYHIIWHFQLKWQGTDKPSFKIQTLHQAFQASDMSRQNFSEHPGFVNKDAIQALIEKPVGPMYNDLSRQAVLNQLFGTGAGVTSDPVRDPAIPDDFWT